ncbi:MAG TPA: methyltransferase domain-containing protein [Vicinamibacterales bacterium]|jgi:ubiquinone/menaquinone biosynthesis C-methylase UbiE|nr:methyltransferase domain-containing protein [Vicinamibacterales bacterium]
MQKRRALLGSLAIAAAIICAVIVTRADDASDAERLIETLELKAGSTVGEIGAGDGDLTILVARHVGPAGRVFTTELGDDRVRTLRAAVEKAGAGNVTILEGDAARTNLPDGCCDAVFMRAVYHHFGDPAAMNRSLWASLRPGGRLAVMDFTPRGDEEASNPADRDEDGRHGVKAKTVLKELVAAGFERIQVEDRKGRDFLVVVRRP